MSTTVNTGWLKDKNGDKFAPKTLSSQVMTKDGITFESKITSDLATLESQLQNEINSLREEFNTYMSDLLGGAS